LGQIARAICGPDIKSVTFLLHGSFAATLTGHGTDHALVAGILGLDPDDERLSGALEMAKSAGIDVCFVPADLGDEAHPNSVRFVVTGKTGDVTEVTGSSVGGGAVRISCINGLPVDFSGELNTLVISNLDRPGVVAKVSSILSTYKVNIAYMKVFRESKGATACMVIESDQSIPQEVLESIARITEVSNVVRIMPA
jgi:L-serine dehydratase